ncbi:MAG: TolB family protein [Bacillota bacterium]
MRRSGLLFCLCLVFVFSLRPQAAEGGLRRVFGPDYDFWDGDWSPDGRFLALAGKPHYRPAEEARIWLWKAEEERLVLLTNTPAYCDDWPRWSPDGRYLALVRRELGGERRTCIWWKEMSTGAGRRLTAGPDDRQPSWSPDGRAIVFRRGLGPWESVLAVWEAATGKVRNLPLPPGLVGEPFWGSDGFIYYTRYQVLERETKLGETSHRVFVIGGGRLWRYDPRTGRNEPLTSEGFDRRMPALSPDGRWLAFYGQRGREEAVFSIPDPTKWALYLQDLATGRLQEVATNVALTGGPPVWSRDGRMVLFYSFRDKFPALWAYSVADFLAGDSRRR